MITNFLAFFCESRREKMNGDPDPQPCILEENMKPDIRPGFQDTGRQTNYVHYS